MGCGCQTEECSCRANDRGYTRGPYQELGYFLGALTPTEAAEQIFPASRERSGPGHDAATYAEILASAAGGQIMDIGGAPAYVSGEGECVGSTGASNLQLAQTASGLALTGTSIGLVAAGTVTAAALAPFTMGISALIGLFPMIFGHHSAAVRKENSVLCAAVPAANNYLSIIDQAVQSGAATPQDGIHALDSLESDFRSKVSSIIKGSDPTSDKCNAACRMLSSLRAAVAMKKSQYQDLIDGAAQQVVPARPNTVSPAGSTVPASSYSSFYSGQAAPAPTSSDWLPIAALLIGGFFLMRSL